MLGALGSVGLGAGLLLLSFQSRSSGGPSPLGSFRMKSSPAPQADAHGPGALTWKGGLSWDVFGPNYCARPFSSFLLWAGRKASRLL